MTAFHAAGQAVRLRDPEAAAAYAVAGIPDDMRAVLESKAARPIIAKAD